MRKLYDDQETTTPWDEDSAKSGLQMVDMVLLVEVQDMNTEYL